MSNKHIKRCSTLLTTREIKIETTRGLPVYSKGYYLKKMTIASVGEDVEQLTCFYSVDGNVKWYSQVENSLTVS